MSTRLTRLRLEQRQLGTTSHGAGRAQPDSSLAGIVVSLVASPALTEWCQVERPEFGECFGLSTSPLVGPGPVLQSSGVGRPQAEVVRHQSDGTTFRTGKLA